MFTLFVIQTVLSAFAATSGLLFNGYILSVLVWQKRIQNANNLFLLNLAIVDILFCLTVLFGNTSLSIAIGSSIGQTHSTSSSPVSSLSSSSSSLLPSTESSLPFLSLEPFNDGKTNNIVDEVFLDSLSTDSDVDHSDSVNIVSTSAIHVTSSQGDLPWVIIPQSNSLLYLVTCIQGYLWTAYPIIFVWTVAGLTIDKYIAISSPLHYSRLITTRKAACFIFLAWFVGLVLATPPLLNTCTYAYSLYRSSASIHCDIALYPWTGLLYIIIYILFSILLPLVAITLCNFHILLIAESHRHRIISAIYEITLRGGPTTSATAAASPPAAEAAATIGSVGPLSSAINVTSGSPGTYGSSASSSPSSSLGPSSKTRSAESLAKRRGRDAFLPVTQLVGSLLLFTAPHYIVFCYESLDHLAVNPSIISLVTLCLTLMPTINAYIYGVKSRLIRQTFKRLLHRYLYKQDVSLEIERRLSLRSQGSQNSLFRTYHGRRNSCPILVSASRSSFRNDFWFTPSRDSKQCNGTINSASAYGIPSSSPLSSPSPAFDQRHHHYHHHNLRRQSLCIMEASSGSGSGKGSSFSYPVHRVLSPLNRNSTDNGLPPFSRLLATDSVIKLSPIEEQTASSDNV